MSSRMILRGATRRFGDIRALDGLDLTLHAGEWVGLVGPNGAGKTTLLRALCGLERLDAGEIAMDAAPLRRRLPAVDRRRIAIVPQDIALYGRLTARENLTFFGKLNGLRRSTLEDRVAWALAWTGLEERADDQVRMLSGGMRRCLNIGCSVLHRPGVLLLDEPTVGVDVAGRARIGRMLRSLRDGGTTLLQSSHQLRELQAAADRALVMHNGRIHTSLSAADRSERAVRLTLDRDPNGLDFGEGFRRDGRVVAGPLDNVSRDLPVLLQRIDAAGVGVEEVRVEPPQLEDVLARLTRSPA